MSQRSSEGRVQAACGTRHTQTFTFSASACAQAATPPGVPHPTLFKGVSFLLHPKVKVKATAFCVGGLDLPIRTLTPSSAPCS